MAETLIDLEPSEQMLKEHAVQQLRLRRERLDEARLAYESALWFARECGLANTVIARSVGVTEAAVRMFFKRSEGNRK